MTATTPTVTTPEIPFESIVGQDRVKSKLNFLLDAYRNGGIMPHSLLIAPKGCGKTMIARELAKQMKNIAGTRGEQKRWYEINCSTVKSVKQFFNQIIIPFVNDKDCTLIFDEASEIPRDVTMALLTILNPNNTNRTSFSYDDYTVDFDFKRQNFILATSESHKVFHALMDRLDRVELEEYNTSHLAEMIKRNIKTPIEAKLLNEIATACRGNAREAQKKSSNIETYLCGQKKTTFDKVDWISLRRTLGILPLGLSNIELQVLRLLATRKETSLTRLSASIGMTKEALQKDVELYLQKMGLLEITTSGRAITAKGLAYLKNLEAW
jgi:Holliday junction resolvasome RuvABC ATP-dependent DNA helicase subunit